MTRLGLGTIEGPMRHLPREILKHILSMDIAAALKHVNRYVNHWIYELWSGGLEIDLDDVYDFIKGVVYVRRRENRLRRIPE